METLSESGEPARAARATPKPPLSWALARNFLTTIAFLRGEGFDMQASLCGFFLCQRIHVLDSQQMIRVGFEHGADAREIAHGREMLSLFPELNGLAVLAVREAEVVY